MLSRRAVPALLGSLVSNPADSQASPHGWHDTNGASGAEFTITRGNNVYAYLDQDNDNLPDFGNPDGGAALTFDHPVDLNEHSHHYRNAAVTNLFYWNNIFHDVMWRYGFTESAGNFQANNYGRAGERRATSFAPRPPMEAGPTTRTSARP